MMATALSVYIYNDLTDIEIDRLNKLDRPLVTGEASPKEARNLIILLGIIGLAAAFMIHSSVFLFVMIYFLLFFLYSFPPVRLKKRFILNKLTVGIGTAVTYLVGSSATGTIPAPLFLLAAFGFASAFATSMVIDLRDIKGDKPYKTKTIPIVWGPAITIRLAIALVCSIGIATVIGFIQLGFNVAFPLLAFSAFAAWIYVLYPLFRHWNEPSYVQNTVVRKIAPLGLLIQTLTVLGAVL
jgi:4-hydroxybenzoate polyprenyltransferase